MEWLLDTTAVPQVLAPDLDPDQRRVIAHRGGPLLVLAGPGTGKTTTLVETVVARITDHVAPLPPEQILVLTFGRRAAGELRDRIAARIGGGLLPTVATFHSFAYSFVQGGAADGSLVGAPRLLSGAEEDVRIRELIMGSVTDSSITWPDDLLEALPTLGFANEVRAVLARSRRLGIAPEQLEHIGEQSDRPAWKAVGQLAVQEEAVTAFQEVMDYTDLLIRAIALAQQPQMVQELSHRFGLIVVDEYQDTDPLQVLLVQSLIGPQTTMVAVGDPDQGIYGFRGADIRAITRFNADFPGASPTVVLQTARRFGPGIMRAATSILSRRSYVGLPKQVQAAHRDITCLPRERDEMLIQEYASSAALAAGIAEDIAKAHLDRGVPWQQMAILTRTAADMKTLQQALTLAHIPAAIARDDVPLRLEPAVSVLLHALRLCIQPSAMRSPQARDFLMGPLCGLDAMQLRRWGRAQRDAWRTANPDQTPPAAEDLIRDALLGTEPLRAEGETLRAVEGLQQLISATNASIRAFQTPVESLWLLWSGDVKGRRTHNWPERLRSAALTDSRTANHDLDAVMSLFDAAHRFVGRKRGSAGIRDFLDSLAAQELPTEAVAERAARTDAVRILTAHRAKGLEWDEVWIAGVHDGVWPDLRQRGSVLEPERLVPEGLTEPPNIAELMDEERRLLYVACTRARFRVTLCVVDAADASGERPSRFIDELKRNGVLVSRGEQKPDHGFVTSLPTLVATLRNALTDEDLAPSAAALLAELAQARDEDGVPLVPSADPKCWWGIDDWTNGVGPVVSPDHPLPLSGSTLEILRTCPRRWFLERQAHAEAPKGNAAVTGSVVHTIAEFVGKGEIPNDIATMDALVDHIWGAMHFDAPWQSTNERDATRAALERFFEYHRAAERQLLDAEVELVSEVTLDGPDGQPQQVRLRGFIDRLEQGEDGTVIPVDLKTQKYPPTKNELAKHAQLGIYQYLVRLSDRTPGGAELVQLRVGKGMPKQQVQAALGDLQPTWIEEEIARAAHMVRQEVFPAISNDKCKLCAFQPSCPAKVESVGN